MERGEAERYNYIREKSGLSKKDFAKSLGLSVSMNWQIATGHIKLPRDLLNRLAATHNVNLYWFLTGAGPSGLESDTVCSVTFSPTLVEGGATQCAVGGRLPICVYLNRNQEKEVH